MKYPYLSLYFQASYFWLHIKNIVRHIRLLTLILSNIIIFAKIWKISFFSAFYFELSWCWCKGANKYIIFFPHKTSGQLLPSSSITVLIIIDFSQMLCGPGMWAHQSPPFPSSCLQFYTLWALLNAHKHGNTSTVSVQKSTLWNPCFGNNRLLESRDTGYLSLYNNQCFYSCLLLSYLTFGLPWWLIR